MFLKNLLRINKISSYFRQEFDALKVLAGKSLVFEVRRNAGKLKSLHEAEFSVFSQWGDDGIIQYLIHTLDIKNKTFIEFGVENYTEANTRFLLINDNWKGLVIDGSKKNVDYIKSDPISWKYSIDAISAFITRENLNSLIENAGFKGEIGILHIDVDGNDYWFWECLTVVNPEIVIMEYNSAFGADAAITVPYQGDFIVRKVHYSALFFGSSLKALSILAESRGYALVGCNSAGNNAYFVRKDKLNGIQPLTVSQAFVRCKFRQNRDESGSLTLKSDAEMILKLCGEMLVYDIQKLDVLKLKDAINNGTTTF